MNRMIKLFQQRSDQAYEKYLLNRAKVVEGKLPIDSHEWNDAVVEGAKLFEQYRIWAKAAELLRKEELKPYYALVADDPDIVFAIQE